MAWIAAVCGFALLHALHLHADFPNHTEWLHDWAKYTDEGWYGNAAIRARLFGNWYVPGDFTTAVACPIWPALLWMVFGLTGVTIAAARGLAVAFFLLNLLLAYKLLRTRGPRWMAMLALTLMVTSPFLYCFSRLAVLEPMLTTFTLAGLLVAVRLPHLKRPLLVSSALGVLFTCMLLTKTTAAFLLPAMGFAVLLPLRHRRMVALKAALVAGLAAIASFGGWMALLVATHMMGDYKYMMFINKYVKPPEFYWPLWSFWWSFHGLMWIDHLLLPLVGVLVLLVLWKRRAGWARHLLLDPVFGASFLCAAGYVLFMTYQNHPQPRYYAFIAVFAYFLIVLSIHALLKQKGWQKRVGHGALALTIAAIAFNASQTLSYALHPTYTYQNAAARLTRYIDEHPNGNRTLLSISGDQLTLMTHLPSLCDDFGTDELVAKVTHYQPGWWATWNDIDPGTLEDLHTRFNLEQVDVFPALDDPERDKLVLFKLHPLPRDQWRSYGDGDLREPQPEDKIEIPVQ